MKRLTYFTLLFSLACGGATETASEAASSAGAEVAQTAESAERAAAEATFPEIGADVASGDLAASLAGEHRTDEERARDPYRHPAETLAFFDVQPEMSVVEIWPGGGWYTRVLTPYLRGGELWVATRSADNRYAARTLARLDAASDFYGDVGRTVLDGDEGMSNIPDNSVDRVLTFRSIHNFIRSDSHDAATFFRAFARVLKPGGILGVVQHRAPEGHASAETGEDGYVSEAVVIALAEQAGLVLDGRSEVNANEADDHAHEGGVWWLPPVMRGAETDEDRAARQALGESDRMTLRFRKAAE